MAKIDIARMKVGIDFEVNKSNLDAVQKEFDSLAVKAKVPGKEIDSGLKEAAQTARYWITTTNQVSINPIRKSKAFRVIPTNGDYEVLGEWTGNGTGCYSACDNYEYGWYMHGNTVFVPSSKLKFTIGNNGTTANATFTYGKWLVVFNSTTTYLLTDMSDLTSVPTPETKTPLFTTATNCLSNCYRTSTDTGILCLQSLSASEATIIDLRNNGFKQSLLNSKLSSYSK